MPESYLGFWPAADLDDVVAGIGKLPCSLCYCREVLLLNLCLRDDRGGQHADAQFTLQPHLNLVQECLVFHGSGQVAMHGERVRGWLVSDNSTGRRRNADGATRVRCVRRAHQPARYHRRRATGRTARCVAWPHRIIYRRQVARLGINRQPQLRRH